MSNERHEKFLERVEEIERKFQELFASFFCSGFMEKNWFKFF